MRLSKIRGEVTQLYLSAKSRACGFGMVVLFQGWSLSIGFPSGSSVTKVRSFCQLSK